MSNNLLGKDENLNAVQPNFVTGGESLSELLSNPKCPLRTLNVSSPCNFSSAVITVSGFTAVLRVNYVLLVFNPLLLLSIQKLCATLCELSISCLFPYILFDCKHTHSTTVTVLTAALEHDSSRRRRGPVQLPAHQPHPHEPGPVLQRVGQRRRRGVGRCDDGEQRK
jgi:hypothetical protein